MSENAERKFMYVGPTPGELKVLSSSPKDISKEHLHLIILRSWVIGRYHLTDHFRQRSRERKFDILDAENAIQSGRLRES